MHLMLGDCREKMKELDAGSVHLTVTSPPYDDLREYERDIDKSWGEHVWREIIERLYEVTAVGGVCVWVVNDATINGSETGTSFRQALHAIEVGFNLHDTMIWQKPGIGCPSPVRYHSCFEYMFVFSKGSPRVFNAIKDVENRHRGSLGRRSQRQRDGTLRRANKIHCDRWGKRRNIWMMNTIAQDNPCTYVEHPAVFPDQLAADHIVSWSNPGDVVLDPMMGSGTVGKMAKLLYRDFIGIEINESYFEAAKHNIDMAQAMLPLRLDANAPDVEEDDPGAMRDGLPLFSVMTDLARLG